jgi:hypothetical protein
MTCFLDFLFPLFKMFFSVQSSSNLTVFENYDCIDFPKNLKLTTFSHLLSLGIDAVFLPFLPVSNVSRFYKKR